MKQSMVPALGLIITTILTQQYVIAGSSNASDPCDGFVCHPLAYCKVDPISGEPKCICPEYCPDVYDPVCGSDNKTYSNKCFMGVAACAGNKTITVQYGGECEPEVASPSVYRLPVGSHHAKY